MDRGATHKDYLLIYRAMFCRVDKPVGASTVALGDAPLAYPPYIYWLLHPDVDRMPVRHEPHRFRCPQPMRFASSPASYGRNGF